MKKTIKVIALLAAAVMSLSLMAGCGESNTPAEPETAAVTEATAEPEAVGAAGTWNGISMSIGDETMVFAEVGGTLTLELDEDGTAEMTMAAEGDSNSVSGTWEQDGDDLSLVIDGDPATAVIDGDTLILDASANSDGSALMVFERA